MHRRDSVAASFRAGDATVPVVIVELECGAQAAAALSGIRERPTRESLTPLMFSKVHKFVGADADPFVLKPHALFLFLARIQLAARANHAMPRYVGFVGKSVQGSSHRLRRVRNTQPLCHLSVRHHLAARDIPKVGPHPLAEAPSPVRDGRVPGFQRGRDESDYDFTRLVPLRPVRDVEGVAEEPSVASRGVRPRPSRFRSQRWRSSLDVETTRSAHRPLLSRGGRSAACLHRTAD